MRTILKAVIVTLIVSTSAFAQSTVGATGNGEDSTSIDKTALNLNYSLPNAAWADFGGHADTADLAYRAVLADLATVAQTAERADFADQAEYAKLAEQASNAALLNNQNSAFYRDATNINAGTLALDWLIGSVLDTNKILIRDLLSGTYDISITGNAATSDTSKYADKAYEAIVCTGGATGCDY